MWKARHDHTDHDTQADAGDRADRRIHDDERTGDAIDLLLIAASIRGDEMTDDAVAVSEIQQLKVRGHRRDEHPETVVGLTEVTHGERHHQRTDGDVHDEDQILRGRPGNQIRGCL